PRPKGGKRSVIQRFFDAFERGYERGANAWTRVAGSLVRKSVVTLLVLGLVGAGAYAVGSKLPRSFVPTEDMGYFLMDVTLPDGASLQRTREVLERVEELLREQPAVAHVNTAAGFSILAGASSPNVGLVFVALKPWSERGGEGTDSTAIVRALNRKLAALPGARAFAIEPPAIPGLSASGGVDMMLQDQRGGTPQELAAETEKFLAAARKRPELANLNSSYRASVPQFSIDAARDVALKQGVPVQDLFLTLQAYLGGVYVNDFNRFGRQWRVFLQAEAGERATEEAFQQFYVRSQSGQMVPLAGLVNVKPSSGPLFTVRFNGYRSAQVTAGAAPGYSSGQALDAVEEVAKEVLPPGMGIAWTGVSYQEKTAGSAASTFALALIAVFLVLAGLYGSWSLPFSVLLGTPVAVAGAFLGLWGRHFPLDIFTQVGLVMLVGLAAKNAILIVAFARDAEKEGLDEEKAALQGARLRLRPILMTSFAFILGCVPLWVASGAGAVARRELGTTVITGMLAATLLGAIATPALYVLVERMAKRKGKHRAAPAAEAHGNGGASVPPEGQRPAEGHP
ncbi:MAG TPA: efflux RND transporter permease subunit, partial [Myxococcales bacterium]|nr:efflux RND transporter permease subunit [Myxococcales bacterium]